MFCFCFSPMLFSFLRFHFQFFFVTCFTSYFYLLTFLCFLLLTTCVFPFQISSQFFFHFICSNVCSSNFKYLLYLLIFCTVRYCRTLSTLFTEERRGWHPTVVHDCMSFGRRQTEWHLIFFFSFYLHLNTTQLCDFLNVKQICQQRRHWELLLFKTGQFTNEGDIMEILSMAANSRKSAL